MLNLLCEVLIEVSEGVSHCHSTLHIKTFIYLVVVFYPFPVRGVLTGWRIGPITYPFSVMAMLLGQAFVSRANYIPVFFLFCFVLGEWLGNVAVVCLVYSHHAVYLCTMNILQITPYTGYCLTVTLKIFCSGTGGSSVCSKQHVSYRVAQHRKFISLAQEI